MNLNGAAILGSNRMMPKMDPHEYRTFSARWPLQTHWRPATCEEADCEAYLNGWITTVDMSTDLGQRQYHFITHDKERSYKEQRVDETYVQFHYPPGNRCFGKKHSVQIERPALYLAQNGDWRNYTSPARRHTKVEFWVEEMQEQHEYWRSAQQRWG